MRWWKKNFQEIIPGFVQFSELGIFKCFQRANSNSLEISLCGRRQTRLKIPFSIFASYIHIQRRCTFAAYRIAQQTLINKHRGTHYSKRQTYLSSSFFATNLLLCVYVWGRFLVEIFIKSKILGAPLYYSTSTAPSSQSPQESSYINFIYTLFVEYIWRLLCESRGHRDVCGWQHIECEIYYTIHKSRTCRRIERKNCFNLWKKEKLLKTFGVYRQIKRNANSSCLSFFMFRKHNVDKVAQCFVIYFVRVHLCKYDICNEFSKSI